MKHEEEDAKQGWAHRWFVAIVGTIAGWIITFIILKSLIVSTSGALILIILLLLDN